MSTCLRLYLSAHSTYGDLAGSCAPACARGSWDGLNTRELIGWSLVGAGAAVLVADIALFAWAGTRKILPPKKRAKRAPEVSVLPLGGVSPGGARVAGMTFRMEF